MNRSTASPRRIRGLSSPAATVVNCRAPLCALLDDWLCLEEGLHVVLHEQYGDVQVVGVARLRVDLDLLAEYGLLGRNVDSLAAEHLVVDALAAAVGLRDRREDYLHSRHAVERVVAGWILAVLRLVCGDQLLCRATTLDELGRRQSGEGHVHALRLSLLVEVRVAGETVRTN